MPSHPLRRATSQDVLSLGWEGAVGSIMAEFQPRGTHERNCLGVVSNPILANLVETLLFGDSVGQQDMIFSREGARRRKGERKVV